MLANPGTSASGPPVTVASGPPEPEEVAAGGARVVTLGVPGGNVVT